MEYSLPYNLLEASPAPSTSLSTCTAREFNLTTSSSSAFDREFAFFQVLTAPYLSEPLHPPPTPQTSDEPALPSPLVPDWSRNETVQESEHSDDEEHEPIQLPRRFRLSALHNPIYSPWGSWEWANGLPCRHTGEDEVLLSCELLHNPLDELA